MTIDTHAKAMQLLELVANSVHERDPKNAHLMCFTSKEVQFVELWLNAFLNEIKNPQEKE